MIESGVSPVLLQAIVKSLIRFEREMVIEFTDNTVVLDMKYYQFYFMGWIGWCNTPHPLRSLTKVMP